MRILYFSFAELDIPNACQVHTLGILNGFKQNKCKVDAVVPRPKHVKPKIPGVRFFYIWPWRFSSLGKIWVKLMCGIYFFVLCLFKKYDAIYVREMELNPFPRWCSKIFNISYYIEVNGILLLNTAVDGTIKKYLRKVEQNQRLDFLHAKGLIVPSIPRSRWIKEHYKLDEKKIFTILNGADIQINRKIDRRATLNKLGLPLDGFYLGFLGTVWKNYDLKTIIKAMALCRAQLPQIYLIVIGGGPDMHYFNNLANNENVTSQIVDLGFIQPDALYKTIGSIDLALMCLTAEGLEDLGPVTTRFATYAAFKIPVIANTLYLDKYPEKLSRGLFTVPHEDPQALAELIVRQYRDVDARKRNAMLLHEFFLTHLTWKSTTQQILEVINNNKPSKEKDVIGI